MRIFDSISRPLILLSGTFTLLVYAPYLRAQVAVPTHSPGASGGDIAIGQAAMDNGIFYHVFFDQLEGRTSGARSQFRWDGEGWIGTDLNKLWVRSEGFADRTGVSDGDIEAFYDRPLPKLRYFDWQAGIREDVDSGPGHTWAAVGIQGFAPYLFEVAPTFYIREGGNVAGRVTVFYEVLFTQRLVAEPEAEVDMYSKDDSSRGIGSGLSTLDTGVRLRYEFSRKVAPYIGFAYNAKYGNSAMYARRAGLSASEPQFIFGIRLWY
jgi:copper resistance protein B